MQVGRTDGWKSLPNTPVLYSIYLARNSGLIKARSPQCYTEQMPVCLQPFPDPVSTTGQLPLVAGEVHLGLRKKPNFCCIPAPRQACHFLPFYTQVNITVPESLTLAFNALPHLHLYLQIAPVRPHPQLAKRKQNQCPGISIISLPLCSSPAPRKTSVHPSSFQKQGKNPP